MLKFNYFLTIFVILNVFIPKSLAYQFKDNAPVVRLRHREDTRKSLDKKSPNVLNAVGKLSYKKLFKGSSINKKLKIDCTANLIAPEKNMGSDIILTAKHCIYKKIKKYTWSSQTNDNEKIKRTAKVIYQDDSLDWALLKLTKAVSHKEIKPLIINNEMFNNEKFKKEDKNNYLVAGFSMDWLGDYGKILTYEDNPNFIKMNNKKGEIGAVTYQGDSGGAIIYQNKNKEEGYLVGIMSYISGNKTLFKNEKGVFGNLTGNFLNLVSYDRFFSILKNVF